MTAHAGWRGGLEELAVATSALERHTLEGVMGGGGELLVVGGDVDHARWLADVAAARLADLEDRWSRFRPLSDVSRLNRSPGRWVEISPDTRDLLLVALEAVRVTSGRFDLTVGSALTRAGYDRTFAEVARRPATAALPEPHPTPGATALEVDAPRCRARVATGAAIDLGGIGKGAAADLVADELMTFGAIGACVNLGGDVAVRGSGPHHGGWAVSVADPIAPDDPSRDGWLLRLATGGVATSTTLGRRWPGPVDGDERHHLIDPSTSRPSTSRVVAATVVASEAAWAEVVAKAALLAGPVAGRDLVRDAGLAGLLTTDDGATSVVGDLDPLLEGDVR